MVKAKLYKQNHTQKHIHTHTQKKKKGKKYIYIFAPKIHLLNLGWFVVSSGIPQMQGTSSWLWRFSPLLLRLLGEISLCLLCSHSSWSSAMDLDPPLRVGHLRASVLRSHRTGLKEQLPWWLWLTQAEEEGGYGCGVSLQRQRLAWRCSSLRHTVHSPGDVVPGSRAPAVVGCTFSWDRWCGQWPVLAHRLLGGGSSSLSVSCPSLGSVLIATARTGLWSSFRQRSESPLLEHQETKRQEKVSCLFGSSRPFSGLPPS